jgi:hypothetical protein
MDIRLCSKEDLDRLNTEGKRGVNGRAAVS